jgi:hypothetical protein
VTKPAVVVVVGAGAGAAVVAIVLLLMMMFAPVLLLMLLMLLGCYNNSACGGTRLGNPKPRKNNRRWTPMRSRSCRERVTASVVCLCPFLCCSWISKGRIFGGRISGEAAGCSSNRWVRWDGMS